MAPEQVKGAKPSPAMDIYAAGTTLYEVLSGEQPYPASSLDEFIDLQANQPPPALRSKPGAAQVPAGLERVVHRALERNPAARHPSMADFEADLNKAQQEAGLQSSWDDLPPPGLLRDRRRRVSGPTQSVRRRKALIWAAASFVVLGLAALLVVLFQAKPPKIPELPGDGTHQIAKDVRPVPPHLEALLRRAEEAVAKGSFTHPEGESALDLLQQIDQAAPQNSQTSALRTRIAQILEAAGDRLAASGLRPSARTLYQEALLFNPQSARLASLAFDSARQAQGSKTSTTPRSTSPASQRPEAIHAKVAWLLSQVQLAVAEGRYLQPSKGSALFFLTQLKELDPSGAKATAARSTMTETLRRKADGLWQAGELASALPIYQMVLLLNPHDALARTRSRPLAATEAPSSGKANRTNVLAQRPADPLKASQLVAAGKKQLAEGRLREARQDFLAAIKAHPQNIHAVTGLAAVSFEEAQYTQTIELATQAIAMGPRHVPAHLLLGDAFFKLLRYADALQAWQKILQVDPKNRSAARRIERAKSLSQQVQ